MKNSPDQLNSISNPQPAFSSEEQPRAGVAQSHELMTPFQPKRLQPEPLWLEPLRLEPLRNFAIRFGIWLLIGSFGLFVAVDWLNEERENGENMTVFFFHYAAAWAYTAYLVGTKHIRIRWQQPAEGRPMRWIALVLWLISAFALNRELAVFQQSTLWLQGMLVVACLTMIAYSWKSVMSVRAQQWLYLMLAVAWWLFLYASVYLSDLYLISFPALLVLGISIHTFIPLLFAIALGKRLVVDYKTDEHLRLGIWVGLLVPLVGMCMFFISWQKTVKSLEDSRSQTVMNHTGDLPDWVSMAQKFKHTWLINRLLTVGSVYDEGPFMNANRWQSLTATDDVKQHDPLVVMASRLFPLNALSGDEKVAILRTISGDRHHAEEKFWLGRNLTTEQVITQARIWPQFRLAYTEKTIRIRNSARRTSREALYTFHLPEGSVVSALSLWIRGHEEKARLTTIAKADSAYRRIVDVESRPAERDPAVVYWQEGNRVTVRVFPCPAGEDRQFRLGITSPLRVANGRLVYENSYFDGPDASHARETVSLTFAQKPDSLSSPWSLSKSSDNQLTYEGDYEADWLVKFKAPALSTASFQLDGYDYQVAPIHRQQEVFRPTDVYLDVNAAWQRYQFTTAFWVAKRQKSRVWVFDDGLKPVTSQTLDAVYEKLSKQQFSLFPIYRIATPETALLITKGTRVGPTLHELANSQFAERLQQSARLTTPIRTFCYADGPLSPYLKTLAELHTLNVTQGSTGNLIQQISQRKAFPKASDTPNQIVLPIANVVIQRQKRSTTKASGQAAPDHLARLFAYNDIMHRVGHRYFDQTFKADATLMAEAQAAHVLSPVSSLIVLETEHDYDRFGIKRDHSGLDNATLKEEGAVPEPHEWALLAVLVVFLIGLKVFQAKRYV